MNTVENLLHLGHNLAFVERLAAFRSYFLAIVVIIFTP